MGLILLVFVFIFCVWIMVVVARFGEKIEKSIEENKNKPKVRDHRAEEGAKGCFAFIFGLGIFFLCILIFSPFIKTEADVVFVTVIAIFALSIFFGKSK